MAEPTTREMLERADRTLERLTIVNALNTQIGNAQHEVARKRTELADVASDAMPNASTISQCLDALARAEGKLTGLRLALTIITR